MGLRKRQILRRPAPYVRAQNQRVLFPHEHFRSDLEVDLSRCIYRHPRLQVRKMGATNLRRTQW